MIGPPNPGTLAAGFKASSAEYLMLRMRIDEIYATGPRSQYVWQFLIDTNPGSDPLHYVDFSLQLDRKTDQVVEFVPASPGGPLFHQVNLSHTAGDGHWTGAISDYSRIIAPTSDAQELGNAGAGDSFLDLAIPWTWFSGPGPWGTGLPSGDLDTFLIYLTTSDSHIQVNKDVPMQCGVSADQIPEPATMSLLTLGVAALVASRRRRRP